MDDFMQLVSNVGFPIAAFCAMWYMCNNTIKENTNAINEICKTIAKFHGNTHDESEA